MELTIENLRHTFKYGYEAFEESRRDAAEVWDLYHNRHYTTEQLAILAARGQPAETFNIIKQFSRMMVGYYSTVVNTMVAQPMTFQDITAASLMTDVIDNINRENKFTVEGDKIKLGGLISGLFSCAVVPVDTGLRDEFGRAVYKIRLNYVPDSQLVLDPNSTLDDYSDARWLHRFKWMDEYALKKIVGSAWDKVTENWNYLEIPEADRDYYYGDSFVGSYRCADNYLVVHTVWTDDNDRRWSVYWCGDRILRKEEITFREAKWPYRISKLHDSDRKEYYGIFKDVVQSQHAINQAVLKIQLMVNSSKAYVEEGAVEDLEQFTTAFNRITGVIPVLKLNGIKLDNASADVQGQYIIIDRAIQRIQQVLGINDSFLGMAFASDSGRKVKLQQNATIMSLRYATSRLESFYSNLGSDIAALVKQFYTAHQIIRVSDEITGQRWVEINAPMTMPTGRRPDGGLIEEPIFVPSYSPDTLEPEEDDEGNIIMVPVNDQQSELAFNNYEMVIESRAYNDEDEKAQLLLETTMSGHVGVMMSRINPAGFLKMGSLVIQSMKTKYSPEISQLLSDTAQLLQGNPEATSEAQQAAMGNGAPQAGPAMSKDLKLPQNTNEGAI